MNLKIKNMNWRFNSYKFSPMRIVALILLIIAWSNGTVSGILAWILLLLIVDISMDINKH
jgi:phage shock protein PspC (stress-responsive transcriptional regulator)